MAEPVELFDPESPDARRLDPVRHAAEPGENDPHHCKHCGHAITISVTHIWPLKY